MERPTVKSTIKDAEKNITYVVLAYRKLTREEMVSSVRHFWAQKKRPKVKPGETVIIETIYGHDQPETR